MPVQSFGKILMVLGALLLVVGVLLWLGGRAGLGTLPGDVSWKRGNTSIYFPIVSSLVISVLLTIILNFVLRFFR